MSIVKYRSDIDGLRALAVVPVVVFHTSPSLVPGGFLGVDIFFVISGYLISLILFRQQADGSFRFADFYGRRIRRLFPALILVLAATLGFGYYALLADEYERLARHASYAIAFLLNFCLMREAGYFDVVSYSKPLLHLWSLSVEEQFYVCWPILLVLFRRMRASLGWLLVLAASASFTYALWLGDIDPDTLYYHPLTRFWELLVGAGIAYLHHRHGDDWLPVLLRTAAWRHALSAVGLLLVVSALLAFGKTVRHPGLASIWPLLGVACLIAAGPRAVVNRILSFKPLVAIGLISYPLYLWHWPILSYIRIMESGQPRPIFLWAGAGLSVLLAVLTYRLAELPLRRRSVDLRKPTLALGGVMAVWMAGALAIEAQHGWPGRSALAYVKRYEAEMVRQPIADASCRAQFRDGTAPVYCRLHRPGPRMIALIGDSHAHVLFPGVAALAEQRGYGTLLLANSGCPPLLGAVTGRNTSERQLCARAIETIIDAVRGDKRIVSVVMASRGPQYLNGLGYGAVEANYNYPPITTEPPPAEGNSSDPAQVFADGLMATARRFDEVGIRVAYQLQVPELGVSAKDCIGRPLTLSPGADRCSVAIADYQRRMRPYRDIVFGIAARAPFLQVIDVEPVLCSRLACSGFADNQLLYADDNHLSVTGSFRVAPLILNVALAGLVAR